MLNITNEDVEKSTNEKRRKAEPCEVCLKIEHKYKCPRCAMKTCSLVCCRKHKLDNDCSGERDKVKYVSKDHFDESVLLNDYRFLEEQARLVDNYQRCVEFDLDAVNKFAANNTGTDTRAPMRPMPHGVFENLRKFVHKNNRIALKIMPAQSTRHRFNRTRFNKRTTMVSWSLELIFNLDDNDNTKLDQADKRFKINTKNVLFSSKETLKNVLVHFYEKFKSDLFDRTKLDKKSQFVMFDLFNADFESQDFTDISVLYEMADFAQNRKYFVKFELDKTLEENLANKVIIEYPTLYVVKNSHLGSFNVEHERRVVNREDGECDDEEIECNGDVPATSHSQQNYPDDDDDDENEEGELLHDDYDDVPTSKKNVNSKQPTNNHSPNAKKPRIDIDQNDDRPKQSQELEEGEEGEID